MQAEVIIRQARPVDIEAMAVLISFIFAMEEDFSVDREKQRRGLEMLLAFPDRSCLLVAEAQQKIVGMCSAQLLVSTAEGGLKALVEDVVIDEAFRGQGIGRKMLAAVSKWAANKGVKRLDLLADRDNKNALAFYDRLGWKRTNLIALQTRCSENNTAT